MDLVHASGKFVLVGREEVPVAIERDLNRRVAEMRLHGFGGWLRLR